MTNLRQPDDFGGQLYVSTSSGSAVRIGTVGTGGLPTTAGQTITNLPGFPTGGSPNSYVLVDLDSSVGGAGADAYRGVALMPVCATAELAIARTAPANGVVGPPFDYTLVVSNRAPRMRRGSPCSSPCRPTSRSAAPPRRTAGLDEQQLGRQRAAQPQPPLCHRPHRTGATATLTYVGRYDGLKADLLNWDSNW